MPKVNFKCPGCGDDKLILVYEALLYFDLINIGGGDLDLENPVWDCDKRVSVACNRCRQRLNLYNDWEKAEEEAAADEENFDPLYHWLKRRGMLDEKNIGEITTQIPLLGLDILHTS